MTIENLARLINAQILNKPSVSGVLDFTFNPKSVRRGFAFIAQDANEQDLELAVKNGAYAVICEEAPSVCDSETAYLKVQNLQTALVRLMRFESAGKNLKFCLVNAAGAAILGCMSLSKNASLLPADFSQAFMKILRAKSGDVFFTGDARMLQRIAPAYDSAFTDAKIGALNPSSIFFTTLICDGIYYQNLALPRVFTGTFCGLLHYLRANGVEFKLGDMRALGHFEPIFIDKNFRPAHFGASFRALITESDDELFEIEAAYLRKNFDPADVIFCLPTDSRINIAGAFRFSDLNELKGLKNFRYALINANKSEILTALNASDGERNLFE